MPTGTSVPSRRGEGGLLAGLRHGDHAHKPLSAIPAWQRGLPAALWHGDPAHKYSRGILSWRRGLLDGLRHGDHAHRCSRGIPAWRGGSSGRSSARPSVSIFGERGNTLRPARTYAYSAPGNTPHPAGPRHIQWAPAYSVSARRFSRARRRRGMSARHARLHIQRPGIRRTGPAPGIFSGPPAYSESAWRFSRARRRRGMSPRHIHRAP